MEELCWIDGKITPLRDARVSAEDRGFVFADGVYEVLRVYGGRAFAVWEHLTRLQNSCRGIELSLAQSPIEIQVIIADLISRSGVQDGLVYLQATRGAAPRAHLFPKDTAATLMLTVRAMSFKPQAKGHYVVSIEDERWKRCWVKAIVLLPNVLAKNAADRKGAEEAILVESGMVNEGSSSNVFLVQGPTLVTTPVGAKVLPGITRALLLPLAQQLGMKVEERAIRREEVERSDEAFLTSTTREVAWIERWDEHVFGSGEQGEWTARLAKAFSTLTSANHR